MRKIMKQLVSVGGGKLVLWIVFIIVTSTSFCKNVANGHPPGESFDFVVVGGGTAGCTVASRLSENGRFSVLLLEAGPVPHPDLDIPALAPVVNQNGDYTKEYQTYFGGTSGQGQRAISYVIGQTLGGGSSVNGMVFNRGSPHDWDNWGDLTGDQSWNYKNMLATFKKVENYMGDYPSDKHHGYSGPITISRPRYAPAIDTILEAGRYLGYPVADPNGPQRRSFSRIEYSRWRGRRVSAYRGYLKLYLGVRDNLKVVTGAKVERILFEDTNGTIKAVGVQYTGESGTRIVHAIKEVILSAGAIESPTVLLRSGIGPKVDLERVGIPVMMDLPVGRNLHDHVVVRLQFMVNDSSQVFLPERDLTSGTFKKYNLTGEGPYTFPNVSGNAQAFLVSSFASRNKRSSDWPDLQIQFVSGKSVGEPDPPEDIKPGEVVISGMVFFGRPKSRGRLSLNSSDPLGANPILDFGYLEHPHDMRVLLDGIQKTLRIYEGTPAFQMIGARYTRVPIKECHQDKTGSEIVFRSRDYWKCLVENTFQSGWHAAGSCRMGRGGYQDPEAVVDTKLRVIGVEGLRIMDASIMPQVTNANLQAPVYAIAEKGAEMILRRWN